MELGVRDWAYIIGGLVILAVLLDGFRRRRADRMSEIRVSRRARKSSDGDQDVELTNPELPGGGARVIKVREEPREKPLKPPPVSALSVAVPRGTGRPEPAESKWQVAGAADTADHERDGSDPLETSAQPAAKSAAVSDADDLPPMSKPFVATRDDAIVPPELEPEPAAPKPEKRRGGRKAAPEPKPQPAASSAAAAALQAESAPAPEPDPEPQEDLGEPVELIVLNVMAPAGEKFRGREMLEILLACDLRLGSMNIFHRYEQAGGKGREQFSVINSVEPGVFDLDNIDEFETPGVGFFMRLPGPEDPMEAFECMLETARCLVKNLDGQLLDDRHSAATGQTVEHYRQRIRDFERKQLTLV